MFRKRFFPEFAFQLLVGVAVTAALAVTAVVLKIWTWPNAIVGGVLLLCGLMYLMERLEIGPTPRSRIRNWLDESGFGIQTHNDSNSIHFVMVDNVGLYTHVIQAKHGDPVIISMPSLKPSDAQLVKFNAMTQAEQESFWAPIRLELLRSRSQYTDLKVDGEGVCIYTQLAISRNLSGVDFLREVLKVRSAGRLYLHVMNEALPA